VQGVNVLHCLFLQVIDEPILSSFCSLCQLVNDVDG